MGVTLAGSRSAIMVTMVEPVVLKILGDTAVMTGGKTEY